MLGLILLISRGNDLSYWQNIENQIETLCNVYVREDGREGICRLLKNGSPSGKTTSSTSYRNNILAMRHKEPNTCPWFYAKTG
jgi:hypothetical protein